MRSTFLVSLVTVLAATLTSAAPAALPQVESTAPSGSTTTITIDNNFLLKLEEQFRASSAPAAPEITPYGDIFNPDDEDPSQTISDLNAGKCGPVILIYAKGTTQGGNIGQSPGLKFARDLKASISGASVQGVLPYNANVIGYLAGGDGEGATSMANLVIKAAKQCPSSKIVMSGYSQGAQVVHKAIKKLATSYYTRIAAVVTIGDPNRDDALPSALQAKRLTVCNDGDPICDGLPLPIGSHAGVEYEKRVAQMVSYIKARV
ncbi:cutinase-domain-containing protein [Ascobolus immersus RN42]|uniref:Cutinase n=1 Tax=Ascobolus immersus RN42 TaxID=1160509 RepID=A0A3N4HSF9_ASCIM|nr:cutinase-domain-containing protein [Ascobolus immersus RN42]